MKKQRSKNKTEYLFLGSLLLFLFFIPSITWAREIDRDKIMKLRELSKGSSLSESYDSKDIMRKLEENNNIFSRKVKTEDTNKKNKIIPGEAPNYGFTKTNETSFGYAPTQRIEFNNYLYTGTETRDSNLGAEIWRYNGSNWQKVVDGGFNDTNNAMFYLSTFGDYLMVSTYNLSYTTFDSNGGEIWRCHISTSCDEESDFERVVTGGFGDTNNYILYLTVIDNYILADTLNYTTGFEFYRSTDGEIWSKIGSDGFGNANNSAISSIKKFDNNIYLATQNWLNGLQIYKSIDNGASFVQVGSDGLGSADNMAIADFSDFGDYIYWSTFNASGNGFEIWRSLKDASSFERVVSNGFNDVNNYMSIDFTEFNGKLYTITFNDTMDINTYGTGTELWRTSSGTDWEQVGEDGFGNSGENSVLGNIRLVSQDYMYIGIQGDLTGMEVWRTRDGDNLEQINNDGFGNVNNIELNFDFDNFNNQLYIGVLNNDDGGEIWKSQSLSPSMPSNFSFTLPEKNTGNISMSFKANDQIDMNNLQAKIEYSKDNGVNWSKATLGSSITATNGSPAINNENEYQVSNVNTLPGENQVNFTWDAYKNEIEDNLSNIKIKIILYDGIGESENYISDAYDFSWPYPEASIITGAGPGGTSHIRAFNNLGTAETNPNKLFAYAQTYRGGVRVATGDIDADGVDEIITGTGENGGPHLRVFEKNGTPKSIQFFPFNEKFRGGMDVAAGDFDGDSKIEIAVSQFSKGEAWVKVYRYNTSRTILFEKNVFGKAQVGATVAMGDVDKDGKDELIVGAGPGGGPQVKIFDYNLNCRCGTEKAISSFFVFNKNLRTGVDVAAGDVDKDGKAEIAVSLLKQSQAKVKLFRYNTERTTLAEFNAYGEAKVGANIAMIDLDRDGKAEIITGANKGGGPHVRAFKSDGTVFTSLNKLFAYSQKFKGGVDVAGGNF